MDVSPVCLNYEVSSKWPFWARILVLDTKLDVLVLLSPKNYNFALV